MACHLLPQQLGSVGAQGIHRSSREPEGRCSHAQALTLLLGYLRNKLACLQETMEQDLIYAFRRQHTLGLPYVCLPEATHCRRAHQETRCCCSTSAHAACYQISRQREAQPSEKNKLAMLQEHFFDGKMDFRDYTKNVSQVLLFKIMALNKRTAYNSEIAILSWSSHWPLTV